PPTVINFRAAEIYDRWQFVDVPRKNSVLPLHEPPHFPVKGGVPAIPRYVRPGRPDLDIERLLRPNVVVDVVSLVANRNPAKRTRIKRDRYRSVRAKRLLAIRPPNRVANDNGARMPQGRCIRNPLYNRYDRHLWCCAVNSRDQRTAPAALARRTVEPVPRGGIQRLPHLYALVVQQKRR